MVRINLLTYFTFEINMLVDNGLSMTVNEVKKLCEEKRIINEIEKRFPQNRTGLDLSLLKPEIREELHEIFYDMALALNKREFLVEKNGLCLLIAYAQEQIQREVRKLE